MLRAVLDANVLVSAVISPLGTPAKILLAMWAEAFDLVISESILDEIGRVLRYPRIQKRHGWPEEEIREAVSRLRRMALLTPGSLTPALECPTKQTCRGRQEIGSVNDRSTTALKLGC